MRGNGERQHSPEQSPPTPTEASKAYLEKVRRQLNAPVIFVSGAATGMAMILLESGLMKEALFAGGVAALTGLIAYRSREK